MGGCYSTSVHSCCSVAGRPCRASIHTLSGPATTPTGTAPRVRIVPPAIRLSRWVPGHAVYSIAVSMSSSVDNASSPHSTATCPGNPNEIVPGRAYRG